MKILVIEDENRLADAIGHIMREQKYFADVVYNGQDGYDYGISGEYDVIILDIMLPNINGFDLAKKLRAEGIDTPILMLTAKDETESKVKGLDSGGDDYMTKPFNTAELLARVRALSRRRGEVVLDDMVYDDLCLKLATCELCREGKSVRLSYKEFEVMKYFMMHQKSIISKDELISKVWGDDSDVLNNNVEAYISFLRKKIYYLDSRVSIDSIRKVGYRLAIEEVMYD